MIERAWREGSLTDKIMAPHIQERQSWNPILGIKEETDNSGVVGILFIYGCGAICRRNVCHFYRFSPSFKAKMAKKRCCKFPPSLFAPGQSKYPKIGLRLQSQALFSKKVIGTAVSGLSIVHFGFKCRICWPFGTQKSFKLQKC